MLNLHGKYEYDDVREIAKSGGRIPASGHSSHGKAGFFRARLAY